MNKTVQETPARDPQIFAGLSSAELLGHITREAFRAGWMKKATRPDEHEAGPGYMLACEHADWLEWAKHNGVPNVE